MMEVSALNDVKIYNLSSGKLLPEWLSDRKRRKLQQQNIDIRQRIELIQDFQMPDVSSCVSVSRDGQYIYATGTYKPRVRCYDVNNLSLKFERCLDCDVVKMEILSDGYEKLVFLEEERFVEFHVQYGHYHKLRIPKFGRDMVYHPQTADLYIAASGPEVYRVNLEEGRMMVPLKTEGTSLTACHVNPEHGLFVVGTEEGKVEAWDHRSKERMGILDCAISAINEDSWSGLIPVSSVKFKDGLTMAVGMENGMILLYDIRSNKPVLVKDQQFGQPIRCLEFVPSMNLVVSMDSRIVKFWSEDTGKPYTAIEPGTPLNQLCLVPKTGLMFIANESPKILTYFMPSLGVAPKWCSFLDNITEELEEDKSLDVYDDYKFVTVKQLEDIGLSHLVGTNLLRAYMHGYFVDNRLYKKAQLHADPSAYEKYKKDKIREKLEGERLTNLELKKKRDLPKINRNLAERLQVEKGDAEENAAGKKKLRGKMAESLLVDDRFSALFRNPDFQVDTETEEYRLLNPALSKLDKLKQKKKQKVGESDEEEKQTEEQYANADDEMGNDSDMESSASSSSDEEASKTYKEEMRRLHRDLRRERRYAPNASSNGGGDESKPKYELKSGEGFKGWNRELENRRLGSDMVKLTLQERLQLGDEGAGEAQVDSVVGLGGGSKEITFKLGKKSRAEAKAEKVAEHVVERRKERRSAGEIVKTLKRPRFPGERGRFSKGGRR